MLQSPKHTFWLLLSCLLLASLASASAQATASTQELESPRRLAVMFFGAPTQNGPHHDPITRYRVAKRALGVAGIDLTYVEDPAQAFTPEQLARFDAVLMYGNWNQRAPMPREQLAALLQFVDSGGGFVPVHCASACFGGSPRFIKLVGARFARHGGAEFQVQNVVADHPILRGLAGYKAWDETYEHDQEGDDRNILQTRDGEPWSWTRQQGKGRVFYTASGHDHRVWGRPEFLDLLRRAVIWAVGSERAKLLERLQLPELETEAVSLPGYRDRREITRAQKPLSPSESQKLAQVPPGMTLQLFCSEPDIVNPIHVAWDHRGRAFVIETIDYPNNLQQGDLGHDRITICEDTDDDGRADRFTRFAEGLSIPTSLCFANGGVICTNGRDMLFLEDSDGDDVADRRRVLFTGFSMGDTHAGVSNLRYGFDGWVYATIGYSGFRGEVGGTTYQFAQGVFRFRPDGSELEFLQNTTNNTWGLGFGEAGDIVGSTANGNPSFYLTFARSAYQLAGIEQPRTPGADDNPVFFAMSEDIRQVDQFDRYTAAAGHAIYTARRFPSAYQNRVAFVCGPTGKLVGQFALRRDGAGFRAEQLPNNLYGSADAWSAPVCAEVGPDGAVWICDWYNIIVQHNPTPSRQAAGIDAKTGRGNAYETPLRDKQHGRIWRVFPSGSADEYAPDLRRPEPVALLAALGNGNLLWRLHAQRLLVEGGASEPLPQSVLGQLRERIAGGGWAGVHALHVLAQVDELDAGTVVAALQSSAHAVRRAALHYASPEQIKKVYVRAGGIAADGRELAEVLVALSRSARDPEVGTAIYAVAERLGDAMLSERAMRDAWTMAARSQAADVLAAAAAAGRRWDDEVTPRNLLPNPGFEHVTDGRPDGWPELRHYSGAKPDRITVRSAAGGRAGSRCLEIRCDELTDFGVATTLSLDKGARYRLSGWLRTEGAVARGAAPGMMLNVHSGPHSRGLTGDNEWSFVSFEFEAWRQEHTIHCLFGGYGGAKGVAFYDDLELVKIGSTRTLSGALRALSQYVESAASEDIAAAVPRKFVPDPAVHERGAAVFQKTCITCHGVDGKGAPNVFPPLFGSDWVTGTPDVPIRVVLHGLMGPIQVGGKAYTSVMAPLGSLLDDQQVADVLTYVRQSFGNDARPVAAEEVARVRKANEGRTQFWTAGDLGR